MTQGRDSAAVFMDIERARAGFVAGREGAGRTAMSDEHGKGQQGSPAQLLPRLHRGLHRADPRACAAGAARAAAALDQVRLPVFTIIIYAAIGIMSRTTNVSEYYVAGRRVPAIYSGMATGADWMSAASFIGLAGTLFLPATRASPM